MAQLHSFKLGCWNINGLSYEKLHDNSMLNIIDSVDCCIFVETFLQKAPDIQHQYTYCRPAVKVSKRGRATGGIIVIMKDNIRKGTKIVETNSKQFVWIHFDEHYFNLSKHLYVCASYIPPIDSNVYTDDKYIFFNELNEEIEKFSSDGDIIIMGDLNARTSISSDIILDDKYNSDFSQCDDYHVKPHRNNCDHILNSFGKKLLEICKQTDMVILNGRCLGDLNGQTSCYKYNGSSVVDYGISSKSIYNDIIYYCIHKPNHLSDHAPMTLCLGTRGQHGSTDNANKGGEGNDTNNRTSHTPPGFRWTNESPQKFEAAFGLPCIKNRLQALLNQNLLNKDISANSLCTELADILIQAAKHSLKHRKTQPTTSRKSAPWFNGNLHTKKSDVIRIGKELHKSPKNNHLLQQFSLVKKCYKNLCKYYKRKYMNSISTKLESVCSSGSHEFWKFLKSMRNKPSTNMPDSSALLQHFKNLHTDHNILQDPQTIHISQNLGSSNPPPEISTYEIEKAIKSLKNGKAHGQDLISNEMIKNSIKFILQPLHQIFNYILNTREYPEEWSKGHVVPIYKSGDKSNPKNYRGISISSCLGKLFATILNEHLLSFLNSKRAISKEQIGFQRGKRTSDHALTLKTIIDYYKTKHKKVFSCFVDFRAAFDKIWHAGLINKLRNMCIPTYIINLLKSMYSKLNTQVKIGPNIYT